VFVIEMFVQLLLIIFILLVVMSTAETVSSETSHPDFHHLINMKGNEAVDIIKKNHPHINVILVNQNAMMTMDYRQDRIRVFVDDAGNVSRPPRVG